MRLQITCQARLEGDARFVKTDKGFRKICSFHLHFYGVKMESPSQTIKVEQSQSDRSKKAFHPVLWVNLCKSRVHFSKRTNLYFCFRIDLRSDQITKITVGRLHFSETTSNNMRKKGKPNPDQRYFYLVVGLHAHCNDDNDYQIISHCSEKIIVRVIIPSRKFRCIPLPASNFHFSFLGRHRIRDNLKTTSSFAGKEARLPNPYFTPVE